MYEDEVIVKSEKMEAKPKRIAPDFSSLDLSPVLTPRWTHV